jgi:nitrile hydratase subunit beta
MMDTVHDIGGRQGFGPVRWQEDHDEEAFHEEWQARGLAMCMCMFAGWRGKPDLWTLDWFRHVRERIDPIDYLTRDYYDQWVQSLAATVIDNGTIRLEELVPSPASGEKSATADNGIRKIDDTEKISATNGNEATSDKPAFSVGQRIRTKMSIAAFHTRLPAYVRGRIGVIEDYHGSQPLADAAARGVIKLEPLYTIAFEAAELWPEAHARRESVFVDAWESYLEPA